MPIDMGLGNGYLICHVRRDTGEGHDYCIVKGKRLDRDGGKSRQDVCDDHGAKLSRLYGTIRTIDMVTRMRPKPFKLWQKPMPMNMLALNIMEKRYD